MDGVILLIVQVTLTAAGGSAGRLLSFFVGVAYFVGFWGLASQTPGMMLLNLRVVRAEDGGPLDIGRAFIRYLGLILAGIVIAIGLIWVAFDPRKQGWHDKIARTFVVRPA